MLSRLSSRSIELPPGTTTVVQGHIVYPIWPCAILCKQFISNYNGFQPSAVTMAHVSIYYRVCLFIFSVFIFIFLGLLKFMFDYL